MKLKNEIFEIFISILSIIPAGIGSKLRYLAYKQLFSKSGKFYIEAGVTIIGFKNIEIGDNVSINKNSYLYAQEGGRISIGNNCSINANAMLNSTPGYIEICDGCAIGPNTVLRAADHTIIRKDIPIKKQAQKHGEIIVETDVWIAANCVITSDIRIGEGAVIGAGTVVNKDVKPYSVVGGVPARLIKMRDDTTTPVKVK